MSLRNTDLTQNFTRGRQSSDDKLASLATFHENHKQPRKCIYVAQRETVNMLRCAHRRYADWSSHSDMV